jgi:hypothetical protein
MRQVIVCAAFAALIFAALPAPRASADEPAGVVSRCGAIAGRVWRDVSAAVKNLFAKRVSGHPHIAVVEDDGAILERSDINLCGAAKVFYKNHADDRHFLFVFAQGGDQYSEGYNAYYQSLRNDVRGIGRRVEDRSATCGSNGVLLGFANMNGTSKWKSFLFPVLDLWPLGVITHELGHQWIAYINTPIKGMRLTTDPASSLRSHWQPLVHTDASIMYGNHWRKLPFNSFLSMKLPNTFSPLDKYLMGIHGPERVPSFFAIQASKSKIWKHFAMPGNTARGKAVKITIQDIQAALGPRVPDHRSSQKVFKAAFVLVVPKGQKASDKALRTVEYFRRRIPEKIHQETDGAFTIRTELSPATH